jgi:hypothetical protein
MIGRVRSAAGLLADLGFVPPRRSWVRPAARSRAGLGFVRPRGSWARPAAGAGFVSRGLWPGVRGGGRGPSGSFRRRSLIAIEALSVAGFVPPVGPGASVRPRFFVVSRLRWMFSGLSGSFRVPLIGCSENPRLSSQEEPGDLGGRGKPRLFWRFCGSGVNCVIAVGLFLRWVSGTTLTIRSVRPQPAGRDQVRRSAGSAQVPSTAVASGSDRLRSLFTDTVSDGRRLTTRLR